MPTSVAVVLRLGRVLVLPLLTLPPPRRPRIRTYQTLVFHKAISGSAVLFNFLWSWRPGNPRTRLDGTINPYHPTTLGQAHQEANAQPGDKYVLLSTMTFHLFRHADLPFQPAVESAVTRLLVAIKQLLESLTQWSKQQISETQVSDVYVRLGNDFNAAVAAFAAFNIDMS